MAESDVVEDQIPEEDDSARKARIAGSIIISVFLLLILLAIYSFLFPARTHEGVSENQRSIKDLELGIRNFKSQYGSYPWPKGTDVSDLNSADICRELKPTEVGLTKGRAPTVNRQSMDFYFFPRRHLKPSPEGGGNTLVDVWGNEFRFKFDPVNSRLLIWSLGKNGIDETSDGDDDYGDDDNNL